MLRCDQLDVAAGDFVLRNVSFDVDRGEWVSIMGSTGCGKTTLMEAICGLRDVTAGTITIDDRDVTAAAPGRRGIGLVPQDGALFAGMRVDRMMGIGLRARHVPRADRSAQVCAMAERLGISDLLKRRAAGLSGGERQRIALGRALLCKPSLLCLDEPLSALDGATRSQMRSVLRGLRDDGAFAVLHVTHDQQEADALAHTIRRMEDGRLDPVGSESAALEADT